MKKYILLFFFVCCMSILCSAQKIRKNEVDKFTKNVVIETSSEKLLNVFGMLHPHRFVCALRKVNDSYVLPSTLMFDMESVKITEDDGVYFLLDNDDVIFLPTSYTGITDIRNSFDTVFPLSPDQVSLLKEHPIVSIRMTYLGGHYEHDVPKKNQSKLIRMFQLISEAESSTNK